MLANAWSVCGFLPRRCNSFIYPSHHQAWKVREGLAGVSVEDGYDDSRSTEDEEEDDDNYYEDDEDDDDDEFRDGTVDWEGATDWEKSAEWTSDWALDDGDESSNGDEDFVPSDDAENAADGVLSSYFELANEDLLSVQKEEELLLKRSELEEKGLTAAQISVLLGTAAAEAEAAEREEALAAMVEVYAPPKPQAPPPAEIDVEKFLEKTASPEEKEIDTPWGTDSSHKFVDLDDDGEPLQARFVFVDEHTCVGCTFCAGIATNTFMMEEEYGRARVFNQAGDAEEVVMEAIATCPVDCIHYVSWEDLIAQEVARDSPNRGSMNFKARLVGGTQEATRAYDKGQDTPALKGNSGARCNNCPGNGCKVCPMFGVGENPIYVKRKMKIDQKRKVRAQKKNEKDGPSNSADL